MALRLHDRGRGPVGRREDRLQDTPRSTRDSPGQFGPEVNQQPLFDLDDRSLKYECTCKRRPVFTFYSHASGRQIHLCAVHGEVAVDFSTDPPTFTGVAR